MDNAQSSPYEDLLIGTQVERAQGLTGNSPSMRRRY